MRRWMKFGLSENGDILWDPNPLLPSLYVSMPHKEEVLQNLFVILFGNNKQATTPVWSGFRFLEDRTLELNTPAVDCNAAHFEWDHSVISFTGLTDLSNYFFNGFPLPNGFSSFPIYTLQRGGDPPSKNG